MKRTLVSTLAKTDELIDFVLYPPAVVKAFSWLPRWWSCDLAKLSIALDERWGTHVWPDAGRPGPPCAACGRRAAWLEIGGHDPDDDDDEDYFLRDRRIPICGYCHIDGVITNEEELQRELAAAARCLHLVALALALEGSVTSDD